MWQRGFVFLWEKAPGNIYDSQIVYGIGGLVNENL